MYHIFTDIVRQTIEVPEMCQQKWGPHHQRWQGDTSRGGWTAQLYRGRVWIGARVWWRTAAATETTENSNCCEMDWQRIRGTEWVGLLCFVLALRHKKTGSSYMNHTTGTAQIWRKKVTFKQTAQSWKHPLNTGHSDLSCCFFGSKMSNWSL